MWTGRKSCVRGAVWIYGILWYGVVAVGVWALLSLTNAQKTLGSLA
jgi:hypothetical protein